MIWSDIGEKNRLLIVACGIQDAPSVWPMSLKEDFSVRPATSGSRPTPKGVGPVVFSNVCTTQTHAAGGGVCVRSVLTHSAGDSILSIIIALIPTTHARARRQHELTPARRAARA